MWKRTIIIFTISTIAGIIPFIVKGYFVDFFIRSIPFYLLIVAFTFSLPSVFIYLLMNLYKPIKNYISSFFYIFIHAILPIIVYEILIYFRNTVIVNYLLYTNNGFSTQENIWFSYSFILGYTYLLVLIILAIVVRAASRALRSPQKLL